MSGPKISRALAAMLLRDLPDYIAKAEKSGIAPPALTLRYADGLSRADAMALWQWGQKLPEVRQAQRDQRHPDHAVVKVYETMSNYFLHDHPQQPSGEPAAWAEPISPALAGMILGTRNRIEAGELNPAEAAALAAYGRLRGDAEAAPIKAELASLYERAAVKAAVHDEPGEAASPAAQQEGAMTRDNAQARADELGRAMHSRSLSPIVKGKIADELAELHSVVPGLKPFSTAGMPADEIAALRNQTVRYMPSSTSATSTSSPARAAVTSGAGADFRSERTRALNERLKTAPRGPARQALLNELDASLVADQAAHDSGEPPAIPPQQPYRPPLTTYDRVGAGPGVNAPPSRRSGPIPPAELRQALAGRSGAERQARLAELFGPPAGDDAA